ncbi:MAG: hypothetical protein WDO24_01905 [Pseudomonadota bacterium]
MAEPLRVVPVRTAGLGVDAGRQFAQFDILPSNQGLVVMARADGIAVRQSATNIVVGGGQGLALSRTTPAPAANRNVSAVFDFQRWLGSDVDFIETRQMLQRADTDAMIAGDTARVATSRFELAQFLLARGHAADAVGVLNVIAADNPRYASDPQLKALRGAARVMLEDGPGAKADLSDPQLSTDNAALLWRAAATGLSGSWAEADPMFRRAGQVPTSYPPAMRQRLLLLAAEAALDAGDSARVRAMLDGLQRGEVPVRVRAPSRLSARPRADRQRRSQGRAAAAAAPGREQRPVGACPWRVSAGRPAARRRQQSRRPRRSIGSRRRASPGAAMRWSTSCCAGSAISRSTMATCATG